MSQDKTSKKQNIPTKQRQCPKYKMSQTQNVPHYKTPNYKTSQLQNIPATKCPKQQNVPGKNFLTTKLPKYEMSQATKHASYKMSQSARKKEHIYFNQWWASILLKVME
jgi:hypothetical protein